MVFGLLIIYCKCMTLKKNISNIRVKKVWIVEDDFHARFSAKERSYVYQILNSSFPPALLKNKVWWIHTPLDINSMQAAANLLIGKHDFSTFRASECQAKSPIKTINSIRFEQDGNIIKMHISAKSFLHHQVRNIIGSLALVGQGKWTIKDFETPLSFESTGHFVSKQSYSKKCILLQSNTVHIWSLRCLLSSTAVPGYSLLLKCSYSL